VSFAVSDYTLNSPWALERSSPTLAPMFQTRNTIHDQTKPFVIFNGVKQGGILSPFLYAVYIDELSLCLESENTGCRLSKLIINHLLFADDAVVFAFSAKGLYNVC